MGEEPEKKLSKGLDFTLTPTQGLMENLTQRISAINNDRRRLILLIIKKNEKLKNPPILDARGINSILSKQYNEKISEQALRKHLDNLVEANLLTTITEQVERTFRGERTVITYRSIPNAIDHIILDLRNLTDNLVDFSTFYAPDENFSKLTVIDGEDENKEFLLKDNQIRIGRKGEIEGDEELFESDIILDNSYKTISRFFKPHALLLFKDDSWYIIDKLSKGGTYLNNDIIERNKEIKLANEDVIKLSTGNNSVKLLFSLKSENNKI